MTRIEVDSGWYMTEESVASILNKYRDSLQMTGRLVSFLSTTDDDVHVRPEAIIAIVKVGFVPAQESNND